MKKIFLFIAILVPSIVFCADDALNNQTSLSLAITEKNLPTINALLNNAPNIYHLHIDEQDSEGNTPLMLAIKTDDVDIIKAVLAEVPNPFIKNTKGETAEDLANALSSTTTKNPILALLKQAKDQYILYESIEEQDPDIKKLITSDVSLNISSIDRNPLITAIRSNNLDAVKLLIEQGANVNQILKLGITPLMVAIEESSKEIINLLLNNAANANAERNDGKTPLLIAINSKDNADIMKLLVEHGANINHQSSIPGRPKNMTVLMLAVYLGFTNLIPKLLALGANPLLKNNDGKTALDFAQDHLNKALNQTAQQKYKQAIKLLQEAAKKHT